MKIKCPYCNGEAVKRGKRKTRHEIKQLYFCKACNKRWTENNGSQPKIALFSLTCYNRGMNLREIVELVEKKFRIQTNKSSVHRWIKKLSGLSDYHMLRSSILKRFGKDIITTKVLKHQGVVYHFKYHKGKLALLKGYDRLADYLENFVYGYPKEFFEFDANRCSKVDIEAFARREEKENAVCKATELVLKTVEENSRRHKAVEEFLLINDSDTVAVEVPVWLWDKAVGGITGHIDILQVRDGKIFVLDFKPDEVRDRDVMSQLYLYALGLSFRTKIPLEQFRCAWFNDKVYYEFEPSKAITRDYWKRSFGQPERNTRYEKDYLSSALSDRTSTTLKRMNKGFQNRVIEPILRLQNKIQTFKVSFNDEKEESMGSREQMALSFLSEASISGSDTIDSTGYEDNNCYSDTGNFLDGTNVSDNSMPQFGTDMPRNGMVCHDMPRNGMVCHEVGKVCHDFGKGDFLSDILNLSKEGRFG